MLDELCALTGWTLKDARTITSDRRAVVRSRQA